MTAYPEVVFHEASLAHEPSQELWRAAQRAGEVWRRPSFLWLLCAAQKVDRTNYRAVVPVKEYARVENVLFGRATSYWDFLQPRRSGGRKKRVRRLWAGKDAASRRVPVLGVSSGFRQIDRLYLANSLKLQTECGKAALSREGGQRMRGAIPLFSIIAGCLSPTLYCGNRCLGPLMPFSQPKPPAFRTTGIFLLLNSIPPGES